MNWSDIPFKPTAKALRQFALAWLVFFAAFGAHQYLVRGHRPLGLALGALAAVIGVGGLVKPAVARWVFVSWMVLAFPIGWLISQLMLVVMFYGIITPAAMLFRLWRRDLLSRRPAPGRPTFWIPKQTPPNVRSYFRQY